MRKGFLGGIQVLRGFGGSQELSLTETSSYGLGRLEAGSDHADLWYLCPERDWTTPIAIATCVGPPYAPIVTMRLEGN